jgi:hypothetical protein
MKISDIYGGKTQDDRIECVSSILKFRKILFDYAKQSGSQEANKLAAMVAFSLFGAACNYKACCILHFAQNYFYDEENERTYCPVDGRVLCVKCKEELAQWILDTGIKK